MTTIKKPVEFGRGIENKYGNKEYVSKCGRYLITRREYDLPCRSIGYILTRTVDGSQIGKHEWDHLSEAKLWACEDAQPGYVEQIDTVGSI
jgi:hypothetical protein